jgi:hypothetical protein
VDGSTRAQGSGGAEHGQGRQKPKQKKNIGIVFLQKKQEHGEAGTAKQGTEQSL